MRAETPPVFVDRVVFATPVITVGEFRCTVNHPKFEGAGPVKQDRFVFPRLAVAIQHEHEHLFVANTNIVTFYHAGQVYRRQPVSPLGAHCDWFSVDRRVISEMLDGVGRQSTGSAGPIGWSRGPSEPGAVLALHDILESAQRVSASDPAEIEERVIRLLAQTMRGAMRRAREGSTGRFRQTTRDAIHHIEFILSTSGNDNWHLTDLAQRAGLSVFHLCRAFRAITGRTIHQYRQQLRLRSTLPALRRTPGSLVDIALDAGFCSHSHFTSAFRREFGMSPSQWRRKATAI